jgi:hypothetical protein
MRLLSTKNGTAVTLNKRGPISGLDLSDSPQTLSTMVIALGMRLCDARRVMLATTASKTVKCWKQLSETLSSRNEAYTQP